MTRFRTLAVVLYAILSLAVMLPSCGSDAPTAPQQPPPPPPPPPAPTPANVTATLSVLNANPSALHFKGKRRRTYKVKTQTRYSNSGTESAFMDALLFNFGLAGGGFWAANPPSLPQLPAGETVVENDWEIPVELDTPDNVVVSVGIGGTWRQTSDATVGGTIDIPMVDVPEDFTDVLDSDVCVPSPTTLCLRDNRFKVEVEWRNFDDTTGPGMAVPLSSDEEGEFWFFAPENAELLVKVLDGCDQNERFWVFTEAITNTQHTVTFTDTEAGESIDFFYPEGTGSAGILDTDAFATCFSLVPVP